ncbi:MAG: HD domain-containing protein [Desulfobulbus sp.]|jgi:poly(A) polymerase
MNALDWNGLRAVLPSGLRAALVRLLRDRGGPLYLSGGAVRDLLRGQPPGDVDLTVANDARGWAAALARMLGGAYVPLGRQEDAARMVCGQLVVDIAAFREGAATILDDLRLRDLTVNALAVPLDALLTGTVAGTDPVDLLDPTGGRWDLEAGRIRLISEKSLLDDPLRLLRVFRFAATLDWTVDEGTLALVQRHRELLARPSPERIAHELDLIMAVAGAHRAIAAMAETGLLWVVLPELAAGVGMEQPASHHLDVFHHSLEALLWMGRIIEEPGRWFPANREEVCAYLAREHRPRQLRWAALLHDLGKPITFARRADRDDRITFYNHDRAGAHMVRAFARNLRWSNEDREAVALLIEGHMRPFHLVNSARRTPLSLRAAIRLIRWVGEDLPGLFCLAMADSLAGQGEGRWERMEAELADLYHQIEEIRQQYVKPVQTAPPLVTGRDLITLLQLEPGPLFKVILEGVELARMEGRVRDREAALAFARELALARTG